MATYYLLPRLFLRSPFYSFQDYAAGVSEVGLADPQFQAALYLASPGFYRQLESKNFDAASMNARELLSVKKYLNRMHFRPTPFGLFSTFSIARWGTAEQLILCEKSESVVHIQTDHQVNVEVGKHLAALHLSGKYQVNPTLYRQGNELRFLKSGTDSGSTKLIFSLESIEANSLTTGLIKFIGSLEKSDQAIVNYLMRLTHCTYPEAISYLEFLRDAQVLKNKSDMNIIGGDHVGRSRIQDVQSLSTIDFDLADFKLSSEKIGEGILARLKTRSGRIEKALGGLGLAAPDKIFYANTGRRVTSGTLSAEYQSKLVDAVNALLRLSQESKPQLMADFKEAFTKRFEERSIPLLQAMDPDSGVGYGNLAALVSSSPLLDNVGFKEDQQSPEVISWTAAHRLLFEKWQQVGASGTIELTTADLDGLPQQPQLKIPPSFPVLFRIAGERVLIENAGGISGAALLGRFTALSAEVLHLSREIAQEEITRNPGVLFAELGQLSDNHNDNVNRRMNCYDYEIPVNSISLNDEEHIIHLKDLYLSVKNNEVILESQKHNRPVIPRLSSAYNFQKNELAIFRFLCDLQYQSFHSGFSFDLEHYFPGLNYYPRVCAGETIIGLAKWYLTMADLQPGRNNAVPTVQNILELKKRLSLPDVMALKNSDQQLVFDLGDPEQRRLLADCITGMKTFTLQEFLLPDEKETTVTGADGRPLINQFIAFMINDEEVYRPKMVSRPRAQKLRRNFIVGSEWIYFKIYCTPVTSNGLLVGKVLPIIKKLQSEDQFSWFFIRYHDPGSHIRLRIRVKENRIGHVIALLKSSFENLIGDSVIREYKADTYQRELERYGERSMMAVEQFFSEGSNLYIHYLKQNRNQLLPDHQFAVLNFATVLEVFLPEIGQQIEFIDRIFESFFLEFKGDKALKVELGERYRHLKKDFSILEERKSIFQRMKLMRYQNAFRLAAESVAKTIGKDDSRRHALMADMIHMQLNRVFTDQQRKQEMVIYYCFYKYKLSQKARMNTD